MKRIAIFGATGLAGTGVLRVCLDDPDVASIVAITRKPITPNHEKLRVVHCSDFSNPDPIAGEVGEIDVCLYCLGVSSTAVSETDYRRITRDYTLAAAHMLLSTSPLHHFFFVSGGGASLDSRFKWARVKAETEEMLKEMGLAGVVCVRPGMILGEGLPGGLTPLNRAIYRLLRLLRFVPGLSIDATELGHAMLQLEREGHLGGTFDNKALLAAARRRRESEGS